MEPDPDRSDQVVARVVSWHNRHPLAKRINATQVHSVGVVGLPYAACGAGYRALFSEDFIAPLRPQQVARWVAEHGVDERPLEPEAPQRLIAVDEQRRRQADDQRDVQLHVLTAAVGVEGKRERLLLAPGGRGAVLGRRHWSVPRLAAAAGTAVTVLALGIPGLWWHAPGHAAGAPAAAASAPATGAAVVSVAAAAETAGPAADIAEAAEAAESASRPASVHPRRGRVEFQPLVPRLADGERQELRSAGRGLRRQPAGALPANKAWALVTAPLADKRQSERVTAQLHAVALLQPQPMRAELVQSGAIWRAVFWPFPTAQDAEKLRLSLANRGLRTELLEF